MRDTQNKRGGGLCMGQRSQGDWCVEGKDIQYKGGGVCNMYVSDCQGSRSDCCVEANDTNCV